MNLLMSDIPLEFVPPEPSKFEYVDLSHKNISNCRGCFACWVKTPGKCVIRDDAVKIYPLIAQSKKIIYVTRIRFGSYDTIMKTMLERAIPIQQPFIRLYHGETHHIQRAVKEKDAVIIVYGDTSEDERLIFRQLVMRNAYNMLFKSYRIHFTEQIELESVINKEIALWDD